MDRRAGSLLSANVGLPQDVAWRGRIVHTAVWKRPVDGPQMVRRLNIDGDGQGDLAAHGGEHRAVFVYQIDSYRYWQEQTGPERLHLRAVRGEPHRHQPGRRPGVHRRPLPDRLGGGRGDPAAGHLSPGGHPDGRSAHPRAADLPSPPGNLPAGTDRRPGAGRGRHHQDRLRARGHDGRGDRRPAVPVRALPPAGTAGTADPGAARRVANLVPGDAQPGPPRPATRA
jgi:hypothetical protein